MDEAPVHDEVAAALGAAVRDRRTEAGLTSTVLARRTGLTQPFISQLENGKAVPSLVTLYRIAAALGVAPQDLLEAMDRGAGGGPVRAIPAGHGRRYRMTDDVGSAARLLAARAGTEVVEYHLETGFAEADWFEHGGSDLVYVVRGSVVVELGGRPDEHVRAGGALEYPGHVPHRWRSAGLHPATLLLVGLAR
jgi:transcriptional regulator with XRE-family HTH domain